MVGKFVGKFGWEAAGMETRGEKDRQTDVVFFPSVSAISP
jgi:hypothetical protein